MSKANRSSDVAQTSAIPDNSKNPTTATATGSQPQCPACAGGAFRERQLLDKLRVRSCLNCGLLLSRITRTQPVAAEFTRINHAAYHKAISQVREQQAAVLVSFVKQHVAAATQSAKWLDIGCSFGRTLAAARAAGFTVFGVEPDITAFKEAERLLGANSVCHGLMTNDTRPDDSQDIISTLDVLEHIPVDNLSEFAAMVRRKLRQRGGVWLIKLPSTDGLYFNLAHTLHRVAPSLASNTIKRLWQTEYEFPHTVYFNERTLKRFVEKHGFEFVAHRYIEEVPSDTVLERLLMDNTIPPWQARLMAPAFYLINWVEQQRRRSDALVMIVRCRNQA